MSTESNSVYDLQFVFTEESFLVDRPGMEVPEAEKELKKRFLEDRYGTLFRIGFEDARKGEHASLVFLRRLSGYFLDAVTSLPELELVREKAEILLSDDAAEQLLRDVPFGIGTENISRSWLEHIFRELNQAYARELSDYPGTVKLFLTEKNQKLRVPERIFFHLVENQDDYDHPFAFLATYATQGQDGLVRHMPLSYALTEFKNERVKLLTLLSCLNKVAEVSELLGSFVESGELFHPLRLNAQEAYELLKAVPEIEACGVLCRVPNWWKKRYSSITMNVRLNILR